MSVSPESAIYTVLSDAASVAANGTPLKDADIQPTVYSPVKQIKTIRVGNCKSLFAPQGDAVKEFDADIVLQILYKVADKDNPADYPIGLDAVRLMTVEVVKILCNTGLNGAFCDNLQILEGLRGFTSVETGINAVSLLPLRINPSGRKE